ncbi:MAG: DUF2490 domain-containing protein [Crocinitomicaceae bacterium]|nr:DUF2490 domain-containing protein [Crocinitomicaceae bacterium]MBK8927633.1 DUF2490 domain-containing protein [Crocinitomicaceae bacterium]
MLVLFTKSIYVYSQDNGLGSWNILHLEYNINKKWEIFSESQLRSLRFYNHFHYYEFKGGVQYQPTENINFTLAAGTYQTYKEGGNFVTPKNNDEFRLWPQVILTQKLGIFKIEQRYRAEFRFTSNGYRNRFRYRLGIILPFGKEQNGYKPFQIAASNEVFFTQVEPYFERNRMAFHISYRNAHSLKIQLGYIHQFDYQINDETGRDFFQIGFYFELGD